MHVPCRLRNWTRGCEISPQHAAGHLAAGHMLIFISQARGLGEAPLDTLCDKQHFRISHFHMFAGIRPECLNQDVRTSQSELQTQIQYCYWMSRHQVFQDVFMYVRTSQSNSIYFIWKYWLSQRVMRVFMWTFRWKMWMCQVPPHELIIPPDYYEIRTAHRIAELSTRYLVPLTWRRLPY